MSWSASTRRARRLMFRITVAAAVLVGAAGCGGESAAPGEPVQVESTPRAAGWQGTPGRGFPDASDTGARDLTETRDSLTITRPGTVLEDVTVRGRLTIKASDVTVRNVEVQADGDAFGILVSGQHAVVKDSTVVGTPGRTVVGIAVDQGSSASVSRTDVSQCEDGVRLSDDSSLTSSFVHDLEGSKASHYDGVTAEEGARNWRILGNTIINDHTQTSAVTVGDPTGQLSEGVLSGNYLAGGGYVIYSGPGAGTGIQVVDNVFSTRVESKGGHWGTVAYWSPRGNIWRGNVWADGARQGQPVLAH